MGSVDTTAKRAEIVQKFARAKGDTGSPEVQVALLTKSIGDLSKHSASHPNDNSSNRGLLAMVQKRKRLLSYLKTENVERYKTVINALGLRK